MWVSMQNCYNCTHLTGVINSAASRPTGTQTRWQPDQTCQYTYVSGMGVGLEWYSGNEMFGSGFLLTSFQQIKLNRPPIYLHEANVSCFFIFHLAGKNTLIKAKHSNGWTVTATGAPMERSITQEKRWTIVAYGSSCSNAFSSWMGGMWRPCMLRFGPFNSIQWLKIRKTRIVTPPETLPSNYVRPQHGR